MSDSESIPRYRVRLPDGEVELDAIEIVRRFRNRELFTSTEVRPAGGGDWCEIRFDPVLANVLAKPYRQVGSMSFSGVISIVIFVWIFPLLLLVAFPVFLSMDRVCADWQISYGRISFLFLLFLGSWVLALRRFLVPGELSGRDFTVIIPYWNFWTGRRLYREMAVALPDSSRRWVQRLNSWMWLQLQVVFLVPCGAPPTRSGGAMVWGMMWLFGLSWLLLNAPVLLTLWRNSRAWRELNPPLIPSLERGISGPVWRREVWRRSGKQSLKQPLQIIAFELLGVAVLWLPYYGVGMARLAWVEHEAWSRYGLVSRPENSELPMSEALSLLQAIRFDGIFESHPATAGWEDVQPKLDRIRAILREFPTLGWRVGPLREDSSQGDECFKLRTYLLWRGWEIGRDAAADADAFQMDLERVDAYLNVDFLSAWHSWSTIRIGWAKLVELRLQTLSDSSLLRAREYAETAEKEYRRRLADFLWFGEIWQMDYIVSKVWLFPFEESIRAAKGALALKQIHQLEGDYYEHHPAYIAFLARYADYGRIYQVSQRNKMIEFLAAEESAWLRTLRVLVASEEYRRKYGEYPDTLAELTPEFLDAVPLDPFDGKPLRYCPGQMIYSVGANGIDDGGDIRELPFVGGWRDIGFALPGGKPEREP